MAFAHVCGIRDYPKNKIPGICEKEKIKSRGDFIFSFPHSSVPGSGYIIFGEIPNDHRLHGITQITQISGIGG